jgi:hypothetical protein
MLYLYIWFDSVGWSYDKPTKEDQLCIDSGDLFVIQVKSDDEPVIYGGETVPQCDLDETPDGEEYHYVA